MDKSKVIQCFLEGCVFKKYSLKKSMLWNSHPVELFQKHVLSKDGMHHQTARTVSESQRVGCLFVNLRIEEAF